MAFPTLTRRLAVSALAGLSAIVVTVSLAPAAHAEPTVAEVNAQLTSLSHQNEQVTEQFNSATEDVAAKSKQAGDAQTAAEKALGVYEASKVTYRAALNSEFRAAGRSQTASILTSTSSQNYVDQVTTLQVVAARRNAMMEQLKTAKANADTSQATAVKLLADATAKQKALAAQRTALAADQAKYTKLLATLTAAQRTQYFATSSPAATEAQATAATATVTAAPAASGGAAAAVAFALAQRGKPYVYAAGGPNSYDCSGLTAAAWAAAGVHLPHNAAAQYGYGTHVSRDQLQPGDLVFFYSPIGHVGIYIGNGLMVHAPTSGDVVKVAPLSGGYVGATRL